MRYVRAIIPTRYEATRFPGKPITPVLGRPMIAYPYFAAAACTAINHVVVATDDPRVEHVCEGKYAWVRSRKEHTCGTDRVIEAEGRLDPEADIIINVQCDEVLITPLMLDKLVGAFEDPRVDIATLAHFMPVAQARSPARVKVVADERGYAMYFSRSIIPHTSRDGYYMEHIGVYAFRRRILYPISILQRTRLEGSEDLEQLRWMGNGMKIQVVYTDAHHWISINEPGDVAEAERILYARQAEAEERGG